MRVHSPNANGTRRHLAVAFAVPALVLGVDWATKSWAASRLAKGVVTWVVQPWFGLRLITNPGVAFGLGARVPLLWLLVGALAVLGLVVAVMRIPRGRIGLALMLGGAAGNVLSRLASGHVTDFLQVWPWPAVFNLADVALRVGAIWVLVAWLRPDAMREGSGTAGRRIIPPLR